MNSKKMSESQEMPEDRCLFVGDLSRNVTDTELKNIFSKFGELEKIDIKKDRNTGNNLGYGFVHFKFHKDAEKAKKGLNQSVIGDRKIRIGWAQRNTNLVVQNFGKSVTTEKLRELFRKFGPIYDQETFVKQPGLGFVRFKYRDHAEDARSQLQNYEIDSHKMRINWGDDSFRKNSVHVQFDATQGQHITEDILRSAFQKFGEISGINLPKTQGKLKGFGFIHFSNDEDGEAAADQAIQTMNDQEIANVKIKCNFGKRTKKQYPQGHNFSGQNNSANQQYSWNNLYYYNMMAQDPNQMSTDPNSDKAMQQYQQQQYQQYQQMQQYQQYQQYQQQLAAMYFQNNHLDPNNQKKKDQ
eukprot:Anaeramoba_ignava/a608257_411.p1 GENE.a608257_411~~a608257_411.p1  ORF type:complete len:355 (-),score=122.80 a608257_411:138-1202(-)